MSESTVTEEPFTGEATIDGGAFGVNVWTLRGTVGIDIDVDTWEMAYDPSITMERLLGEMTPAVARALGQALIAAADRAIAG